MKTIQNKVTALCMQELKENSYDSEIDLYREMGSMCFPVTVICTLQGTSVTQGNEVIFTGNRFAVLFMLNLLGDTLVFRIKVQDILIIFSKS